MKKITLFLMSLLLAIPAMAVNLKGGEVLYLTPNSNWNIDNARFAVYFFNGGSNTWASMTKVSGETNLYSVTVPAGNWANLIFCRMNPTAAANGWSNTWNQTSDLSYDGSNNHYTVKDGTWNKGGGTWSVYTPKIPTITSFSATPSKVFLGNSITLKSTIEQSASNVVYKVNDETITSPWTPTKAGTYTITATLTDAAPKTVTVEVYDKPSDFVYYEDQKSVFVVNDYNWTELYAYTWTSVADEYPCGGWPGQAMTKLDEKIGGLDCYQWTYTGTEEIAPINVIFNNNNKGSQTVDLTFENGGVYTTSGIYMGSINPTPTYEVAGTGATITGSGTIMYSVDGGEYKQYTDAITEVGNITAYAYEDGKLNSASISFDLARTDAVPSIVATGNGFLITSDADNVTYMYSVNGGEFKEYEVPVEECGDIVAYACEEGKLNSDPVSKTVYAESIICEKYYFLILNEDWNKGMNYFAKFINKNTGDHTWVQGEPTEGNPSIIAFFLSKYNVRSAVDPVYTHVVFFLSDVVEKEVDDATLEAEFAAATTKTDEIAMGGNNIYTIDGGEISTGIESVEVANGIRYAYGVVEAEGAIEVYNVNGTVVARGNDSMDLRNLGRGVYIVRNGNQVRKVVR